MLQIQATISKVQTLVDRSVKISLETQELQPEETASLFNLNGKFGYFLFDEVPIKKPELPQVDPELKSEKTPGQRARNTLYRYWEHLGKPGDFDGFYRTRMEQFIDSIKQKMT